jgi:hypothetical protein
VTAQITQLRVAPATDRRRVRLLAEMQDLAEPFPYLELSLIDPDDQVVATTLVMGVMEPQLQMTLHMRPPAAEDETRLFHARGRLFFGSETEAEETFSVLETEFRFP